MGDYDSSTATRISTIRFESVDVTDSGDYTCEWQHDNVPPTATMSVKVRSKYNFSHVHQSITTSCSHRDITILNSVHYMEDVRLEAYSTSTS